MSGHHHPSNWTFRNVQAMDVDETTRANLTGTTTSPPGQSTTAVHPPSTGFRFQPPMGQADATPPQQAQPTPSFFFGSATGTGQQTQPPMTLAGHFLSQSEGFISGQQKPSSIQTGSLQSFSGSSKRVMIPDDNSFPTYYPCDDPTLLQYLRSVAQSGVVPVSRLQQATQPSIGSLPSASSLYSSQSSVGSMFSTQSRRDHATTLRGLYQMLDAAQSQTDIDQIKDKIRQTLHEMEQESTWSKHLGVGDSHSNGDENISEGSKSDKLVSGKNNFEEAYDRPECEASSVFSQGHLLQDFSKPKKGFFKRVNFIITRVFSSKL